MKFTLFIGLIYWVHSDNFYMEEAFEVLEKKIYCIKCIHSL